MNKSLLILIIALLVFSITGVIFAEEFKEGIELSEGKNVVNISQEFNPLYVGDLVKLYPEIIAVTYIDENKQEFGYVNVFGGIGENFVISQNRVYEIITKQKLTLDLK